MGLRWKRKSGNKPFLQERGMDGVDQTLSH